jgi:chaperonin cofactor prefoldin
MKNTMTENEMARYWRERRERMAKRVKALESKGDWLADEMEKYQEDLNEILEHGSYK